MALSREVGARSTERERVRVFDIVLGGRHVRTEPAGDRIALEVQHALAQPTAPGTKPERFAHVRERYVVQVAKPRRLRQ